MNFFESVDLYCERTSAAFWAEPLNFASNIFFFITAVLLYKNKISKNKPLFDGAGRDLKLLVGLLFLMSLGSAYFHSAANKLAMIFDVLPIGIYILVFFNTFLKHVFDKTPRQRAPYFLAFALATFLIGHFVRHPALNNSQYYFSSLITLFLMATWLRFKRSINYRKFALAGSFFGCAIFFRIIDMRYCDVNPAGTHFLWHTFQAGMLYQLTSGLHSLCRLPEKI